MTVHDNKTELIILLAAFFFFFSNIPASLEVQCSFTLKQTPRRIKWGLTALYLATANTVESLHKSLTSRVFETATKAPH